MWLIGADMLNISLVKVLGIYGNCQHLIAYRNLTEYIQRFEKVAFELNLAWGWTMLATHTAMTASIAGRIMCVCNTRLSS